MVKGGKTTIITALNAILLASTSDCLFLQKKLLPISYFRMIKQFSRHIIYDFDDALYTHRSFPGQQHLDLAKKNKKLLNEVLANASLVIAGNEALADYSYNFSRKVVVIPTTLDAKNMPIKTHKNSEVITIGWIGGEGGLVYLSQLEQVFNSLVGRFGAKLRIKVVSNAKWVAQSITRNIDNKTWSLVDETSDLLTFDIGIMPLVDDEWSRGKCGFKALQMMGVGLPVIVSPVGVNPEIIRDGENGFLASDPIEWGEKLNRLIRSATLRKEIGMRGREHVLQQYNVEGAAKSLEAAIIQTCEDHPK
jgi:glycosyltransferase involved in cell wall biosynthesis